MTVTEKVAYVKGLAEGLGLDDSTKEGKVLKALIDVVDDLAMSVADLEEGYDELCDEVDTLDEDLGAVEEDLYGDEEDDDECGCGCEDEEGLYEVTCPACGDTICVDESILADGEMECPNSGEHLEFDLEELDDEEGCGCEDDED